MIPFNSYIILKKENQLLLSPYCGLRYSNLSRDFGDGRTTLQKRNVSPGDSMTTVGEYVYLFYWQKEEFYDDFSFEALFTDANDKYIIEIR